MPRLETDLETLRADLKAERQARTDATQQAAVLEAKPEVARDWAALAEAFSAELKASVVSSAATRRDRARPDDADRRRTSAPNSLLARHGLDIYVTAALTRCIFPDYFIRLSSLTAEAGLPRRARFPLSDAVANKEK